MGFESQAADLLADAIVKTADTKGARKRRELLDRVLFALGGGLAGYTAFSVAKDPPPLLRDAGARLGKLAAQAWRPSRLGGTPQPVAPTPKTQSTAATVETAAPDNVGGTRLEAAGRFGDSAASVAGRMAGGYFLGGVVVPKAKDVWDYVQSRRQVEQSPDELLARISALGQNVGREQETPEGDAQKKKTPGRKTILNPKLTISPPSPLKPDDVAGLANPVARRERTPAHGNLVTKPLRLVAGAPGRLTGWLNEMGDPVYDKSTTAGKYFRGHGVPPEFSKNLGHNRQVIDALDATRAAAIANSVTNPVELLTSVAELARQAREAAATQGTDARAEYTSRLNAVENAVQSLQDPRVAYALNTRRVKLPEALRTFYNLSVVEVKLDDTIFRSMLGRVAHGDSINGKGPPHPAVRREAEALQAVIASADAVRNTATQLKVPNGTQPAATRSYLQATLDAAKNAEKAFRTPRTPPKRVTVGGRRVGGVVGALAGLITPYVARRVTNAVRGPGTAAERTLR